MPEKVTFTLNLDGNICTGLAEVDKAMQSVNATASSTLKFFDRLNQISFKINNIVFGIQNIQGAIGGITQVGANAELQLMNMKTLFQGDTEAAADMYKRISEYGKVTPYDKAGLIDAQKTMMSFGIEGEKAFETLKQIGDIAMGDSQKMQSLALAFAQMSSAGKLQGQDLLQMINAGFNPLTELSKMTGKTVAELKEAMGKGAISVEMVEQAFASATSEGGLFYKAIDEASQTTAGKMAAIQDTIDEIKVSIFNATGDLGLWVDAAAKMAVPLAQLAPIFTGIGSAVNWAKGNWGKFMNTFRAGIVAVNIKLGILQYSIRSAGGLFKWLGSVIKANPLGLILIGITLVIAAITVLWQKSEGFRRLVMGVWESIKAILNNVWEVVKAVFGFIWNGIIKPYFDLWKSIFSAIWSGIQWLYEGAVSIVSAIGDFFVNIWNWVTATVGTAFNWIVAKLGVVGTWIKEKLVDPIKNAFTGIWTVIKGVFDKILTGLGRLFEPIKELWNKVFPKDKMKDVSAAYATGAEKGSESWRKSKIEGEVEMPSTSVLGGTETPKPDSIIPEGTLKGGNMGGSAGTSAGKAQQISIKLDSMIGTMNFNGGLRENAHDVEAQLTEMMARILGMAETSI